MKKLIVFDLDGTLIDTRADLTVAVNATRADLGLKPLSLGEVVSYVGDGAGVLLQRVLHDVSSYDLESLKIVFRQHYNAHLFDFAKPYDGVTSGLEALHACGHVLAVFSNKPQEATEMLMTHFGWTPLLSAIVGGGGVFPLKPDPAALLQMMSDFSVSAGSTWMVGDHTTDVSVARRAGVSSGFVRWGFGRLGDEMPTRFFDSFGDVVEFLK